MEKLIFLWGVLTLVFADVLGIQQEDKHVSFAPQASFNPYVFPKIVLAVRASPDAVQGLAQDIRLLIEALRNAGIILTPPQENEWNDSLALFHWLEMNRESIKHIMPEKEWNETCRLIKPKLYPHPLICNFDSAFFVKSIQAATRRKTSKEAGTLFVLYRDIERLLNYAKSRQVIISSPIERSILGLLSWIEENMEDIRSLVPAKDMKMIEFIVPKFLSDPANVAESFDFGPFLGSLSVAINYPETPNASESLAKEIIPLIGYIESRNITIYRPSCTDMPFLLFWLKRNMAIIKHVMPLSERSSFDRTFVGRAKDAALKAEDEEDWSRGPGY
jgi:hypothetical protein